MPAKNSLDEAFACPTTGPEYGVWIRSVGGSCPCQADGTMDGNPFYFRARHGEWSFCVTKPGVDPVDPDEKDTLFEAQGKDEYNGYMPVEVAVSIIFKIWLAHWHEISKKGGKKA